MDRVRFYKGVIIILILLNLGAVTFLWLGRPKPEEMPGRGDAAELLRHELALTPQQQDEFRKNRDIHHEKLMVLQEQDRKLHELFFDLIFLPNRDTVAVQRLADSISMLRKQMEMITFEHFMHLRKILTPVQDEKFRLVFRQAIERVMPPQGPPGPPSPPPPPAP